METSFDSIKIEGPKSIRERIQDAVRSLLISGNFPPGAKIPSTRALAEKWGADVFTVHTALTMLEKEGLLIRRHGRGTYVRRREKQLTGVGIYHCEENWKNGSSNFERAVHSALVEELDRRGIRVQTWIDSRPPAERGLVWNELLRAIENQEIQCLISLSGGWPSIRWQNKLPVFSVYLTSANIPNKVNTDLRRFAELSLRTLVDQGCRSVGLIGMVPTAAVNPDGSRHELIDFYEEFMNLVRDLGLEVRNEWIRSLQDPSDPRGAAHEQFGYEEFLKLWAQPIRPEGLVVWPDTAARGVILGLQEKKVRVPDELKLVFHKHESIGLFCPMPVSFVVSSEREYALALIEQIERQFRGERCERISLCGTVKS